MCSYQTSLQLIKVEYLDENSDEDILTDEIKRVSDTETQSDFEIVPEIRKRGRKPLTEKEKEIRDVLKKEYFKQYYRDHPEKYEYQKFDFSNSCIYKLICKKSNKVYIGSTFLPINLRLKRHLSRIKHPNNSTYIEMANASNNHDDWEIEPIVKVGLNNRKELDALESIYISTYDGPLFNKKKKYDIETVKVLGKFFSENILPNKLKKK